MIELHFWPSPNAYKVRLLLEETGTPYRIVPVNVREGAQFRPEYLAISPNNRIPAIVDLAPTDGGAPVPVFESGAILIYLAEKTGRFLATEARARTETLQWLVWQMAGLGPMAGQNGHFNLYAPEKLPYAIDRFVGETNRLYGVLDRRLEGREYIAGAYSIADMACYPWIRLHEMHLQNLDDFPNLKAWAARIAARPATARAYAPVEGIAARPGQIDDKERAILFGQTAGTIAARAAANAKA
jgi:GST-like protein